MAAKSTSSLLKLEKQLTCGLCHDLYSNPKTLPCLHSFCQQCLADLPLDSQEDTHYIACPTCHYCTQLPDESAGAAGFLTAFYLNNLMETYTLMKKTSNPQQVTCDNCIKANATSYCKECNQFLCQECIAMHKKWAHFYNHNITSLDEMASSQLLPPTKQETTLTCSAHKKSLEIFCETCDQIICHNCTVRIHKDHEYDLVSDSYSKHRQRLKLCLNPVKEKIDAVTNIITALKEKENEVGKQSEAVKKEIHAMVDEMINVLYETAKQLTRDVEKVTNDKLLVLSKQKKLAEINLDHLKNCEEYVKQSIAMGSEQQVLTSKKQMTKRMSQLIEEINVDELNPKEKADVQLIKDGKAFEAVHHIGDITFTSLQQCKAKGITKVDTLSSKGVSFSLSLENPDSSLLTVPVSSINCSLVPVGKDQPITATVTHTTHPGVYNIHCSPSTQAHHQVNMKVYDVQLEDISLMIPFNPYLDTITSVRTISKLNWPYGVAVSNDGSHILVTENKGNCVIVLDRDGKKIKSFGGEGGSGNIKFTKPRGIAITEDNIVFVTDNHKIQKLTMDGEYIASVGEYGTGQLQFKYHHGIAISPLNGQIYIADCRNHRIQVLTPHLIFLHAFGKKGSADGQFQYPGDIAINSKGLLYVTDGNNHRIQVFNPDGNLVTQFGTFGFGPGQLNTPRGIGIDKSTDLVYITEDGNHRISIFTSEGVYVRSFGEHGVNEGQFKGPRGIIIDKGVMYVCDCDNNRLVG